jgi:hypothetical protein
MGLDLPFKGAQLKYHLLTGDYNSAAHLIRHNPELIKNVSEDNIRDMVAGVLTGPDAGDPYDKIGHYKDSYSKAALINELNQAVYNHNPALAEALHEATVKNTLPLYNYNNPKLNISGLVSIDHDLPREQRFLTPGVLTDLAANMMKEPNTNILAPQMLELMEHMKNSGDYDLMTGLSPSIFWLSQKLKTASDINSEPRSEYARRLLNVAENVPDWQERISADMRTELSAHASKVPWSYGVLKDKVTNLEAAVMDVEHDPNYTGFKTHVLYDNRQDPPDFAVVFRRNQDPVAVVNPDYKGVDPVTRACKILGGRDSDMKGTWVYDQAQEYLQEHKPAVKAPAVPELKL